MVKNKSLEQLIRTNTPVIHAPEEFQDTIQKLAEEYVDRYACYNMSKCSTGHNDLVKFVRNRLENLTVRALVDCDISKPNEVKSLLRSNCMMTADEERAIIEAYKAQNSDASTYIIIFFSFKVKDFMKKMHLIGTSVESDVYDDLQCFLFEMVSDFDTDRQEYGGLTLKYCNSKMVTRYREWQGKNDIVNYKRAKATSLSILNRKVTDEDARKLSYKQIAQKYAYTIDPETGERKKATYISEDDVRLYFMMKKKTSLDTTVNDDEGSTIADTASDSKSDFTTSSINSIAMYHECSKRGLSENQVNEILSVILDVVNKNHKAGGGIRKLSQRIIRETAAQTPYKTSDFNNVLMIFAECAGRD